MVDECRGLLPAISLFSSKLIVGVSEYLGYLLNSELSYFDNDDQECMYLYLHIKLKVISCVFPDILYCWICLVHVGDTS